MILDTILTELKKLGSFEAYAWSRAPEDNYGVVSADGRNDFYAEDGHGEISWTGTVDWFSRNPGSTVPAGVEGALTGLGAAWYLNSVQYENDTGFLHWEWVWNG